MGAFTDYQQVAWPARPEEANTTAGNGIYNNFEVVDIDILYRSNSAVQALTNRVDASRGNYNGRWGDAIIRMYTLVLHFSQVDIIRFCDWKYEHQLFFVSCSQPVTGKLIH